MVMNTATSQWALYIQCTYIERTVGTMYVQCTYIVRPVPAGFVGSEVSDLLNTWSHWI